MFERKSLLLEDDFERPNTSETSGKEDNNSGEIMIERDTVVSAHEKVG